ncbi:MAG: M1 family aminopeptidase [Candidatus Sulfotelmatobacter sp.]
MKLRILLLCVFCWPFVSALNAFSIDREAFTFTHYDLNVRVEPVQQRLGARGKVTLRNDSQTPQKLAVLQISSSLSWRSIHANGKELQFVSQPYTSDTDHTGSLSEAIVTLPQTIPPKASIELEIAYEGVIVLDATRLTRIGAPQDQANSSDWDQVSPKFTAVRGFGNVAWYPVATEAASLSDGKSLFEVEGRWRAREAASTMHLQVAVPDDFGNTQEQAPELLVNATTCPIAHEVQQEFVADCTFRQLASMVPTFVIADYELVDRPAVSVHFLHGHDTSATNYADAADKVIPLTTEWFGAPHSKAQTADLLDPNAAPFESGSLLLTPLASADPKLAALAADLQLTHAAFTSPRPWINEGLAHFAQALYLEQQKGRQTAVDYMATHRAALSTAETTDEKPPAVPRSEDEANRSLVNTYDEELYRSKAMCVWWMLRDMLGDQALKKAIASYHPEQDKEPSYMPRLVQAQTQRDLEWFFDDWVYRDRGLPDFKVSSAFSRKMLPAGYMLTITVENLGAAGAEVPLIVKFEGGEVMKRLVVRGKSNGVIRVEVPKPPDAIVVNDGSVPESDATNNTFKVVSSDAAK